MSKYPKLLCKKDGIFLASATAALLMSAPVVPVPGIADEANRAPVKVSQCQSEKGIVGISSGHAMMSKSLCQKTGGTEVGTTSLAVQQSMGEAMQVAYCSGAFSCAGFSACKGNGNDNCAGVNTCHAIGFVGIASSDIDFSNELCERMGGTVLSKL